MAYKCTPMAPPPDPGMWWRKKERNECNWKLNAMVWPSIGQTAATWPQSWPLIGCLGSRDARAGLWLAEISGADKYQSRSSDSFTLFVTALRVEADNHTSANLWSRDRKVDQHYQQIADIADTDSRYKPHDVCHPETLTYFTYFYNVSIYLNSKHKIVEIFLCYLIQSRV